MVRCVLISGMCLLWGAMVAGEDPPQRQNPPLSDPEITRRAKAAAMDPSKLPDLIDQVSNKDARRVSKAALSGLTEEQPRVEKDGLVAALVKALPRIARTPEEILDVMGAASRKMVVREIFYRRYREQWIFLHPIRCCVVFDCVKGKDPGVLTVIPLPADIP
jgi:hypothetical protein